MDRDPQPGVGPNPEASMPPSRVVDKTVLPTYQTLAGLFSNEGVAINIAESPEQTSNTGEPLKPQDVRVNLTGELEDITLFDEGMKLVAGLRNDLKGKLSGIPGMTPELMEEQIATGLKDIIPHVAKRAGIERETRLTREKIMAAAELKK